MNKSGINCRLGSRVPILNIFGLENRTKWMIGSISFLFLFLKVNMNAFEKRFKGMHLGAICAFVLGTPQAGTSCGETNEYKVIIIYDYNI
jgi:hypothetical protein